VSGENVTPVKKTITIEFDAILDFSASENIYTVFTITIAMFAFIYRDGPLLASWIDKSFKGVGVSLVFFCGILISIDSAWYLKTATKLLLFAHLLIFFMLTKRSFSRAIPQSAAFRTPGAPRQSAPIVPLQIPPPPQGQAT
jgi:hypothetical protein